MTNEQSTVDYLRVIMENMVGLGMMSKEHGVGDITPGQLVASDMPRILKLVEEGLPLARLLDNSDLMFHAEGPGAEHDMPWLTSVTWLTGTVEKNLRKMSAFVLDLLGADGNKLARGLDIRMTGMAPGSIWIGTRILPPSSVLLPDDDQLIERLMSAMTNLPRIAAYINDETVLESVREVVPDPAMRDASLQAMYNMAPTGNKGIHTLELSAKSKGTARLSQRERVVLREALRKPLGKSRHGTFVGEVRAADLDKTRFHLRTREFTLRCTTDNLSASMASSLFSGPVKVTGSYESDREGRPSLLRVESVEPAPRTASLFE